MGDYRLITGDAVQMLKTLEAGSVQCCVTSPPYYGLRNYGVDGQIGLEETPDAYVAKLVDVFREVKRVLHPTGVLFLNLGDSYAGSGKGGQSEEKRSENWQPTYANKGALYGLKPKDLIGIPWLVAFALRADGWWLRSEIIWHKKAPMPESVTDRPTKAHEQVFLLAKSREYFYDADAIREPITREWNPETNIGANNMLRNITEREKLTGLKRNGTSQNGLADSMPNPNGRNKRSVWTLGPEPYAEAHFATMPTKLVEPCVLAGSRVGDLILDPFAGSGTTLAVALKHGRRGIGIDLNADYINLAHKRITQSQPLLFNEAS